MDLLIAGGTITTESGIFQADLRISDGLVVEAGHDLSRQDCHVVDATGRLVFPGGVDVHTHMDLQAGSNRAADDFYSGTVAAACGGTTTIVDHVAFGPQGCALRTQLDEYHGLASGNAVIDYGFHGVVQHVDAQVLADMEPLRDEGYASFKAYMTYDDHLDDGDLYRVLCRAGELGLVTAVHAENHGVVTARRAELEARGSSTPMDHARSRPAFCEAEAVARFLKLARLAGDAPAYVVHLTTASGLAEIEQARRDGQAHVMAETCVQYLLLDEGCYNGDDAFKYIMSPPLRSSSDREALWRGLSSGSVQVVATDHCPFQLSLKEKLGRPHITNCPNGAPGVEERFVLLYSEGVAAGRLSLERFVQVVCTNPARAMGLWPRKGTLQPGSDGDVVIFNPQGSSVLEAKNLHSAGGYICYEGMTVHGSVEQVFSRGHLVARQGHFLGKKGDGLFLRRHRYDSPF